jgi:hypothetical protein
LRSACRFVLAGGVEEAVEAGAELADAVDVVVPQLLRRRFEAVPLEPDAHVSEVLDQVGFGWSSSQVLTRSTATASPEPRVSSRVMGIPPTRY